MPAIEDRFKVHIAEVSDFDHPIEFQLHETREDKRDGDGYLGSVLKIAFNADHPYKLNWDGKHRSGASYCATTNQITFPKDFVVHGWLRGAHVGTFLLARYVRWARQWPGAEVKPIYLSSHDAKPENVERRQRLYEKAGFRFRDGEQGDKHSLPMLASELAVVDSWEAFIALSNR